MLLLHKGQRMASRLFCISVCAMSFRQFTQIVCRHGSIFGWPNVSSQMLQVISLFRFSNKVLKSILRTEYQEEFKTSADQGLFIRSDIDAF